MQLRVVEKFSKDFFSRLSLLYCLLFFTLPRKFTESWAEIFFFVLATCSPFFLFELNRPKSRSTARTLKNTHNNNLSSLLKEKFSH